MRYIISAEETSKTKIPTEAKVNLIKFTVRWLTISIDYRTHEQGFRKTCSEAKRRMHIAQLCMAKSVEKLH